MAAANTDYYTEVGNPGTATTLAAPGHTIAGTTFNVISTTNWPTTTGVIFAVDTFTTQIVNGVSTAVRTPGSYTEWEGVVTSSTAITSATLRYGTDQNYSAGANTRVYIPVASSRENRLVQGLLASGLTQAGGMGAIAPTSISTSGAIVATGTVTASNFIQTGGASAAGWTVGLATPNTVTALGNRSYSMVFNGTDLTSTVSNGMRLRTTRTVAAPTECTSLNGTTQYYSKSSPSAMTFTDDFVVSAWVKPTSYATSRILGRYNGTSGWELQLGSDGRLLLIGYNAGAANFSYVVSYQSLPLNKWSHVAVQLDMSAFTATTTTSYVMIDGVDVPASVARAGTNPIALVQPVADFQIGAANSTNFFPGKIAQVAIYNAKVAQATILASMHQTLTGSETSLISAYSFNNTINDLSANANNLTANGSAVATNADSPFGGQADGTISSTLDYAIITKTAFSTNTTLTVQVPEGCTIPTSGGVSAVSYSTQKVPYLFPALREKWRVKALQKTLTQSTGATANTWFTQNFALTIPIGDFMVGYQASIQSNPTSSNGAEVKGTLSTTTNSETDNELTTFGTAVNGASTITSWGSQVMREKGLSIAVQAPYYLLTNPNTTAGLTYIRGDLGIAVIYAEPSYL